jgi:hypothetical protein
LKFTPVRIMLSVNLTGSFAGTAVGAGASKPQLVVELHDIFLLIANSDAAPL